MRITLAQLNYTIGDFVGNLLKIKEAIGKAKEGNSDLVVFSELSICGYPPRDFLEIPSFINKCEGAIQELLPLSEDIGIIVGCPSRNKRIEGKDLYNSAFFLYQGKVECIVHKALLPTYDIFDEDRYFEESEQSNVIPFKGEKIALTICEDLWNIDNNPRYTFNPMDELSKQGATIAINIAASPYDAFHDSMRNNVLALNARKYQIPFFYVNQVGGQTEILFDGASGVFCQDGLGYKLATFKEEVRTFDIASVRAGIDAKDPNTHVSISHTYQALLMGIRDYFGKLGLKKALIALSGGIDSVIVATLATHALGNDNILCVLLPSPHSSSGSIDDSIELCKRLGVEYKIISIGETMSHYEHLLSEHFENRPMDVTEENLQARIRATIIMALSNKLGYIVLNTSNKSELSMGYSTMYGDSIGAISVIGDLYKTQVYELANYINDHQGNPIPVEVISKAPSAELRPGQKDEDSLPPYSILDKILFAHIEGQKGPSELRQEGFDEDLIQRVLKAVVNSEFKRFQAPPILRVSTKAFGSGRRFNIVAKPLA